MKYLIYILVGLVLISCGEMKNKEAVSTIDHGQLKIKIDSLFNQYFKEESHPGHQYRIYDREDKEEGQFELFQVTGKYGDHHNIHY